MKIIRQIHFANSVYEAAV